MTTKPVAETSQADSEDDAAPGDPETGYYKATEGRRGGGRGEFLWFVTADRKRDQVMPIADIRRMEPPENPRQEIAYIHFSGVSVALTGSNLRRVLHRITLHRCAALYELAPGQQRPAKGEPVIERMEFLDLTKAVPRPGSAAGSKH